MTRHIYIWHACNTFSRINSGREHEYQFFHFFLLQTLTQTLTQVLHTKHPLTLAYPFFPSLFCCSVAFSGSWPMCLISKGEPSTVEWVSELPWQRNLTAGCNGNVIEREEQTFTYWVGLHSLRLTCWTGCSQIFNSQCSNFALLSDWMEAGRKNDACPVTLGLTYCQTVHSL